MGGVVLKNWKPREIIRFLKKRGFVEIKKKRGGDHVCLWNEVTKAYTEVDTGRRNFGKREMNSLAKQAGITKEEWEK